MTRIRFVLLGVTLLIFFIGIWLWWNRSSRVDMSGYVPADSLIYLEANDLPQIITALASTEAWRELAGAARLDLNTARLSMLSTLAARTGIGQAEAVIASRAQIAVVLLGIEAAGTEVATSDPVVKPRVAVVIETHTSERRVRLAVDKLVGDLARRAYGNPQVWTREAGEVRWQTWSVPGERRQIVAAIAGTVAIIGNDEAAVETCLAVRRGERPNLLGDRDLEEMRRRTDAAGALAFGYISPANTAKLLEIGATLYGAQLALSPQVQSAAATLMPQLLPRLAGAAAWSARADGEWIEDRYFFQVPGTIPARLQTPLAANAFDANGAGMLPADTHQFSAYLYRDPAAAWGGAQAALSSQLDFGLAPFLVRFADKMLEPYGLDSPREFFRHTAPPILTARLDQDGGGRIVIARVRDREGLTKLLRKRSNTRTEMFGKFTLLVRGDEDDEQEAACFAGDFLIMGNASAVRRCLAARADGHTLLMTDSFRRILSVLNAESGETRASVASYERQPQVVRETMQTLARLNSVSGARGQAFDEAAFSRALNNRAFLVSETRLVEGGFEKRTRSVFGLFGTMIGRLNGSRK